MVSVLLLVATVSRDVVNRRWRLPEPEPERVPSAERVPVGAPSTPLTDQPDEIGRTGQPERADGLPEGYVLDAPTAQRRLGASVWVELAISVVVLALTALLVNTPPPQEARSQPFLSTLRAETIEIETSLVPASPGPNELHLTSLGPGGAFTDVVDMSAELSLPDKGIAPIEVELLRAGPGHYISRDLTVPFAGDWDLTVTALVTDVDSQKATATVPIR